MNQYREVFFTCPICGGLLREETKIYIVDPPKGKKGVK